MSPVYERVERLRIITNRSWDQMADVLDIDRSMFFHVKSGRRNLSKKAIFRLEQAERDAGILPPEPIPSAPVIPFQTVPLEKVKISEKGERKGSELAEIAALLREAAERLVVPTGLAPFASGLHSRLLLRRDRAPRGAPSLGAPLVLELLSAMWATHYHALTSHVSLTASPVAASTSRMRIVGPYPA